MVKVKKPLVPAFDLGVFLGPRAQQGRAPQMKVTTEVIEVLAA
jgi:hypothetical protein